MCANPGVLKKSAELVYFKSVLRVGIEQGEINKVVSSSHVQLMGVSSYYMKPKRAQARCNMS